MVLTRRQKRIVRDLFQIGIRDLEEIQSHLGVIPRSIESIYLIWYMDKLRRRRSMQAIRARRSSPLPDIGM
jgi:hypothetical protein